MKRIFWKVSMLSLGMIAATATVQAQTIPGADALVAKSVSTVKVGFNLPDTVKANAPTVQVNFLVSERNVLDHAAQFCAEIGKAEECEQAFRECALGENNAYGCELSPLQSQHDDGTQDYACDQDEAAIFSSCEARVSGTPNFASRLSGQRVLAPGRVVLPTEPEEGNRIKLDPTDLDRRIIDRIGVHKIETPAAVDNPEQVPEQVPQEDAEDAAAAAPAGDFLQGAGCSLATSLTGGANPWEWVLLVFGLIPALRFRK